MQSHLEEYLTYYKALHAPGYAVLVSGAWGAGKTYQTRKLLKDQHWYVSLFGLQTVEEIHGAVVAEAHPILAKGKKLADSADQLLQKFGATGAALSGLVSVASPLLRKELKPEKILVFDDFERSNIPLEELMGAINVYLEHLRFRVVIIANEEKSKYSNDFADQKGKLIGQTIQITPNTSEAFCHFLDHFKDEEHIDFVNKHKETVLSLFENSRVKNLRALRHLIEDLGRLQDALAPKHKNNEAAIRQVVSEFSVFNLHHRSSSFTEQDLSGRYNKWAEYKRKFNEDSNILKPRIVDIVETYQNVELCFTIITEEILIDMLVRGIYSKTDLEKALNDSPYFKPPEELPNWRIVSGFDRNDDELVDSAIAKMNADFQMRKITDPGEFLHVCSLRLMMAEECWIEKSSEEIVEECLSYIEDILNNRQLPPYDPDVDNHNFRRSYQNHVYWGVESNSEYFQPIFDALIAAQKKSLRLHLQETAADLLELLKENATVFRNEISYTKEATGKYYRVPILASISPKEFVDAWLSSPIGNWREIALGLESRYEFSFSERGLDDEREWAIDVRDELYRRAEEVIGHRRSRIQRIVPERLQHMKRRESDAENTGRDARDD